VTSRFEIGLLTVRPGAPRALAEQADLGFEIDQPFKRFAASWFIKPGIMAQTAPEIRTQLAANLG